MGVLNAANFLTGSRIVIALGILTTEPFSNLFYILYLLGWLTDMADGPVARRTGTDSVFGARLDSIADFLFVLACLVRLLPVVPLKAWAWIWIAGIALIRVINIILGWISQKKLVMLHTAANKMTGFLLFLLPFFIGKIPLDDLVIVTCMVATFASVQEGYLIRG